MRTTLLLFGLLLGPPLQKFIIIGTVRDTTGRSVPNVRVSVLDENFQPIRTIFVDASGQFIVRGLSPGRYLFRVETTGTPYQEHETGWIELQSLRVRPGGSEPYPLDIVLKFKPKGKAAPATGAIFVQQVPAAARAEFERGVRNLRDGKTEQGLASLKKALETFPDYFDALELLGVEHVRSRRYEPAVPLLARAATLNARAPRSLYALGVAYLKLNRLPEAVACLSKSDEFEPRNPNTQLMLGLALGNNRQFAKAEEAFKNALQIGGAGVAEAHFYLAGIYDKQQRYAEAARELEMYLKESQDISDPEKIRAMIAKLNAKATK